MASIAKHGWFLSSGQMPVGGTEVNLSETPYAVKEGSWLVVSTPKGRVVLEAKSIITPQIDAAGQPTGKLGFSVATVDADDINTELHTTTTFYWFKGNEFLARVFDPQGASVDYTADQWEYNTAVNIDRLIRRANDLKIKQGLLRTTFNRERLFPPHLLSDSGEVDSKLESRQRAYLRRVLNTSYSFYFRSSGGTVTLVPGIQRWQLDRNPIKIDAGTEIHRALNDSRSRIRINWWMFSQGLLMILRSISGLHVVNDMATPMIDETDMTLEEKVAQKNAGRRRRQ